MSEEEEKEFFEERAGILEFMAGYPRSEAERLARLETEAWLKAGREGRNLIRPEEN